MEGHIIQPNVEDGAAPLHGGPTDNANKEIDLDIFAMKQFFGVEYTESAHDERLMAIRDFLAGGRPTSKALMQQTLMKLERKIGVPQHGLSRVDHVYNYIKTIQQIEELEGLKRVYENG